MSTAPRERQALVHAMAAADPETLVRRGEPAVRVPTARPIFRIRGPNAAIDITVRPSAAHREHERCDVTRWSRTERFAPAIPVAAPVDPMPKLRRTAPSRSPIIRTFAATRPTAGHARYPPAEVGMHYGAHSPVGSGTILPITVALARSDAPTYSSCRNGIRLGVARISDNIKSTEALGRRADSWTKPLNRNPPETSTHRPPLT